MDFPTETAKNNASCRRRRRVTDTNHAPLKVEMQIGLTKVRRVCRAGARRLLLNIEQTTFRLNNGKMPKVRPPTKTDRPTNFRTDLKSDLWLLHGSRVLLDVRERANDCDS